MLEVVLFLFWSGMREMCVKVFLFIMVKVFAEVCVDGSIHFLRTFVYFHPQVTSDPELLNWAATSSKLGITVPLRLVSERVWYIIFIQEEFTFSRGNCDVCHS